MATIRVKILDNNNNNNNGVASRQNRKENDTAPVAVCCSKTLLLKLPIVKSQKGDFCDHEALYSYGKQSQSLSQEQHQADKRTMFFRSNMGNHWNAILREAAKQQNVPIRCVAVRFKRRANITVTYMNLFWWLFSQFFYTGRRGSDFIFSLWG